MTSERNSGDVLTGLLSIFDSLFRMLRASTTEYDEIRARFYGGWLHEDGRWTERADWMRSELRALRGRRDGIRVLPELAVALISIPARGLRGTARIRTDRSAYSFEQKMVDTLLSTDLVLLNPAVDEDILVISDDEDLVPAVMAAQSLYGRVALLRRRVVGWGCNDHHLVDLGVAMPVFQFPL